MTVQRSQRMGDYNAQVLIFTNGTLYNEKTGAVAVPWIAKKLVLSVTVEGSEWKVVNMAIMDFNTNGVTRCTPDTLLTGSYCSPMCPCGETPVLEQPQALEEKTAYIPAQQPSGSTRGTGADGELLQKQRLGHRRRSLRKHSRLHDEGDVSAFLQHPTDSLEGL